MRLRIWNQRAYYCPSATQRKAFYWHRNSWHISGLDLQSTRAWGRALSYANFELFRGWGGSLGCRQSDRSLVGKRSLLMLRASVFVAFHRRMLPFLQLFSERQATQTSAQRGEKPKITAGMEISVCDNRWTRAKKSSANLDWKGNLCGSLLRRRKSWIALAMKLLFVKEKEEEKAALNEN